MSSSRSRVRVMQDQRAPIWRGAQLICVYRHRNRDRVAGLVAEAAAAHADVHLWALDEVPKDLARHTVGTGPGERLELLNRLLEGARTSGAVIVCDDDVSFSRGSLRRLLELTWVFGLDLAQPAHARGSHHSHRVTRVWPGAIARLTRFVEVGPLVVIAPRARERLIPFPVEYGMGWGLDVVWSDLVDEGFRLGIVDDVRIMHHGAVGVAYPTEGGDRLVQAELAQRGMRHISALHETLAVWEGTGPRALLSRLTRARLG